MTALYHPSLYDTRQPIESYWAASAGPWDTTGFAPLEGDAEAEVAIIGGGYTGLTAAYHLARRHGVQARVLEAAPIGWGASGRNGGFCCLGSVWLSLDALVRRFGEAEAARCVGAMREAVELVRDFATEEGITLDAQGQGTITVAHRLSRLRHLEEEAHALARLGAGATAIWSKEELAERGYSSPEAFGAMHQSVGFGLHPLKYCRGLADAALRRGAVIHGESPVIAWRREGPRHVLQTPRGTVTARRVLIATNGFTRDELHKALDGCLLPALSNIVVTRPLSDSELAAQGVTTEMPTSDTRGLLFYVRLLPDRRFMFGARGGLDASPESSSLQRAFLERRLREMYPAWRDVETTHFWRGPVCLSAAFTPHIARLDEAGTVTCALAYHGSGVAMSGWAGRAAAALTLGVDGAEAAIPAPLATMPRRWPVARFRLFWLRLAYLGFRLKDELF